MIIDYSDEQKALRKELRDYFAKLIKPEYREPLRDAEGGELYKRLIRQMGKDGWLALGWPEEYGGKGATDTEQLMFFEEALLAGAPVPFVTLNTVGPALIAYGSEIMKQKRKGKKRQGRKSPCRPEPSHLRSASCDSPALQAR